MKGTSEPLLEIETASKPSASIIWLHGLGADGHDFTAIVPELGLPSHLPCRFIFPHAPLRPVTLNGGYVMRAWFDIVAISIDAPEDVGGLQETEKTLQDLIAREQARGIAPQRIVLAGFSQGGAAILYTGLRLNTSLGGMIALSTYLPLHQHLSQALTPHARRTPIFMAHGTNDPVVPFVLGQTSFTLMKQAGLGITWHTYPMGHAVTGSEIQDIGHFLISVLKT